jgi:hypothetical protein
MDHTRKIAIGSLHVALELAVYSVMWSLINKIKRLSFGM